MCQELKIQQQRAGKGLSSGSCHLALELINDKGRRTEITRPPKSASALSRHCWCRPTPEHCGSSSKMTVTSTRGHLALPYKAHSTTCRQGHEPDRNLPLLLPDLGLLTHLLFFLGLLANGPPRCQQILLSQKGK